jgi:catalase
VLDRNPENFFAESEQSAFGTGVLVDGIDFSDDKMLQGRTLSYSDTQRYRVGANYLQLPINAPKKHVATNQRGGQMAYRVDLAPGQNPHVNYEPSSLGGLQEAEPAGPDHTPFVQGNVVRQKIERTNDFGQAGERYRMFSDFERDELIRNLVSALASCREDIQARMISYFEQADPDYGRRVAEGLREAAGSVKDRQDAAVRQAEERSKEAEPY